MSWSKLSFGKHDGKTLPQILFLDPDWFFWAMEEGVFDTRPALAKEAQLIDKRARSVKIPSNTNGDLTVQYFIHPPTGKFDSFEVVSKSQPLHDGSSPAFRLDHIDMSVPRKIAKYDKTGCKTLLKGIKVHVFCNGKFKFTKDACEKFFSDPANFI